MPRSVSESAAVLTIDLGAIAENWRRLQLKLNNVPCAAVVKADAYGLGADNVAPALWQAGCRTFCVALTEEAVDLRKVLPTANIHVLGGIWTGDIDALVEYSLTPVLNSLDDVHRWRSVCIQKQKALPCDVQFDTGMARLGLDRIEVSRLQSTPDLLSGLNIDVVLSHLACADDPDHPLNAEQRSRFDAYRKLCNAKRASFANSSGIFLGADYHFDLGRPGIALYGGNPTPQTNNPMAQTIKLQGKILQVRHVDHSETVGYGASYHVTGPTRVATVGVGYADGYLRSLSSSGFGTIGGHRIPVVGRISMDLITFDVTSVPETVTVPGALIDLIGTDEDADAVSDKAGTISYEILTSLGDRYARTYVNAEIPRPQGTHS